MKRQVTIVFLGLLSVVLVIWTGITLYDLWSAQKLSHVRTIGLNNHGNETKISDSGLFSHIDPYFGEWDLDNAVINTNTKVDVYEFKNPATSKQAFNSISENFDALCVPQNQVISFCREQRNELARRPHATLFLLKGEDTNYVAIVGNFDDGIRIYLRAFDFPEVWSADGNRLVTPN